MRVLSSLILICFGIALTFGASSNLKVKPQDETYVIEGQKFEASCRNKGTDKYPELHFAQKDTTPIVNSTDGHVKVIIEKLVDFTVVMTITWDPIKLSDKKDIEEINCKSGTGSHGYNIHFIPKASVPVITLKPNETTVSKGKEVTFNCTTSVVIDKIVTGFELNWYFYNTTFAVKKKNKVEVGIDEIDNKSSSLTITKADKDDQGTYFCIAELYLKKETTVKPRKVLGTFYKTALLKSVHWDGGSKSSKTEIESKAGGDYKMECKVQGYPTPTITWMKGDDKITELTDTRYKFSNSSSGVNHIKNSVFELKKVTYADRGVYKCVAMFKKVGKADVTQEFRLRVRDPLGALWPTIGIVVEVILLFVGIGLYELCKSKKTPSNDSVDIAVGKSEKSPLVSGEGNVVSYTSGDEGVRARTNAGNVDA